MPGPGYYKRKFKELREFWGGRCIQCGDKKKLEFAHLPGKPTGIEGKGRGMANRYHDIKNNPNNYILLYKYHHKKLDGRMWDYATHQE